MKEEEFRIKFFNGITEIKKMSDAEKKSWSTHAFKVFKTHLHLAEKYYNKSGKPLPSVGASINEQTATGANKGKQSIPERPSVPPSVPRSADRSQPHDEATAPALSESNATSSFWRKLFGGGSKSIPGTPATRQPSSLAPKANPYSGKAERLQPKDKVNSPTGSKAELISMILELTEIERGGLIEETEAAKVIAASNRFSIDVVKELVIESFFDRMPSHVRKTNTVRSVSMKIGAAMGGRSFARWLAESIVVGKQPAQMLDNPYKYGSFGMWQDAKELCENSGIKFG